MSAMTSAEAEFSLDMDDLESPDLAQIAYMGKDVLDAVKSIREMLQARADVLETCRETLVDQHARTADLRQRLEQEQTALCEEYEKRESELSEREKGLEGVEERIAQLSSTFQVEADELKRRAEELRQRESAQDARKISLDDRTGELLAQESDLAQRKQDHESAVTELDADRESVSLSNAELAEAKDRFQREVAALAAERDQYDEATQRLAADRRSLDESLGSLEVRQAEYANMLTALELRETQVVEQQGTLELRIQQLAKQKDEMIALRRRWEGKINELNAASTNLTSLREQLVEEVGHISNERTDLLNRFGLTERTWGKGAQASGGLPSVSEPTTPASVERYQKLCRDARRRAIGNV